MSVDLRACRMEILEKRVRMAARDLDPAFSLNGKLTTDFNGNDDFNENDDKVLKNYRVSTSRREQQ